MDTQHLGILLPCPQLQREPVGVQPIIGVSLQGHSRGLGEVKRPRVSCTSYALATSSAARFPAGPMPTRLAFRCFLWSTYTHHAPFRCLTLTPTAAPSPPQPSNPPSQS